MINIVFEKGIELVRTINETQIDKINEASIAISNAIYNEKKFFVTGSGHSHTVAEEFYGRAGGLACVTPILTTELTLNEHPTKSSHIERLNGYASILADLYGITKGDVVLIASNSGRNAYPVEMALEAKSKGAVVIAITSVAHSSACDSRAKSGKKLKDVADITIDNCGVLGDSSLKIDDIEVDLFPTSSIANAFIVQAITVQTCVYLKKQGMEPPVLTSLNVMGTINKNDEYFKKYTRLY